MFVVTPTRRSGRFRIFIAAFCAIAACLLLEFFLPRPKMEARASEEVPQIVVAKARINSEAASRELISAAVEELESASYLEPATLMFQPQSPISATISYVDLDGERLEIQFLRVWGWRETGQVIRSTVSQ